ncbi:Molybdenum ABC transporter, substrate-binding protein ModA [hydrothermal vent metagenome]|uniref:Molybdenum ABC transporter, substrate-binding protein ModA n=1 Tax=hydrothermal vent metagenome TaxID=652676 RepID=A0A3B1E073_9ZZZZ
MSTFPETTNPPAARRGGLPPMVLVMLGSLILVALLAAALGQLRSPPAHHAAPPLLLYCAAGVKTPIDEIVRRYTTEYGIAIDIQYGGSGTLLSQIEINPLGDLYLAADDSYIPPGRDKGLLTESLPLGTQRPVIAVAQGNPHNIQSLDDLLNPDIAFGLANPDAAAIGRVTREALRPLGKWEAIERACKVFKPTVTDLVTDIKVGSLDAAILWDCNAFQAEGVEAIEVPEFAQASRAIEIALLTASRHPAAALHFARYLAAEDRGGESFTKYGYGSIPRPPWADHPVPLREESP